MATNRPSSAQGRQQRAAAAIQQGIQHHREGRLEEAARLYRQAAAQDPENPQAPFLLGAIALQTGHPAEAIQALQRAVRLDPQNPAVHSNLGEAYRRAGRTAEAIERLVRAVELRPDLAEAVFNLALVLHGMAAHDAAAAILRRLVSAKPEVPRFSQLLEVAQKASDSTSSSRGALRAAAISHSARTSLGRLLLEAGASDGAIDCFQEVLRGNPGDREAIGRLVDACLSTGLAGEAIPLLRRAVQMVNAPELRSLLLLMMAYDQASDDRAILAEAREWDRLHAAPLTARAAPHDNDPEEGRRLRVGYVSSFADGAAYWFLRPLWANHDRSAFELFCYSSARQVQARPEMNRLRPCFDVWRDVDSLDDESVAASIRGDRIDVLVDLNMHTVGNRLGIFARKPAPVQLCWLAYPGTTGLTAMDYRVTDPHLDGPDSDFGVYAERTLSLPDTFWCYEPGSTVQPNGLPAASGGRFTFGCLNSHMKLNAEVTALWARILAAAPTADLILQAPLNDIRRRLLSAFADQGVDASRVIFSDSVPYHEYLALYHRIDACLDPFPCGGHTTSLDAFWMGLPVVTLRSPSKVVGRAAAGFATTLGLPELVASTPDEYVQIALGLTIDLARLAQWRSELRARIEASPLMDAPRFARSMEALYRKAWSEWVRRRSPGRNEGSGDGPQER